MSVAVPAQKPRALSRFQSGQWRSENVLIAVVGVLVSIAIVVPLLVVVWRSLQVEQGIFSSVYSLDNYARLASPRTLRALGNSLIIAVGAALLATVWGVALAWIVARTNVPFGGFLNTLNLVPFFLSPLLGAISWSYLGSPATGLLNKLLISLLGLDDAPINIYSLGGIIWVVGLFEVPFVYLFCIGALRQMDPALEHAARVCGSNALVTSLRVTFPLAAPSILSGLILSFVLAIEDLGVPLVLGYSHNIQTLSTQIYDGIQRFPPDYNFGAAVGCFLMAITGVCIWLQRRVLAARSFVTITGRGYRPQRLDLGWRRYVALAVNVLYLVAAVILPLATLIAVSFSRAWQGSIQLDQFSTQYYVYLVETNPLALRGIRNSLLLAAVSATLTLALAAVIAYAIHRTKSRWRNWLDIITTVPIGVPGLVLAIGLLVALIRTPLYATVWILIVAYTVRFFSYGQRSVSSAIGSVGKELEESSRTSGASWFTTVRRVLLPLLLPGLVAGWLLLFITFMREVSMSMLLSRSGTETLSVALYSMMSYDPVGAAAAYAVVQVVLILAVAFIFLRLSSAEDVRV